MELPLHPNDLEALSPRQGAALEALQQVQAASGRPPTRAELGAILGVSPQTADFHLRALERKGYLKLGRSSRSIQLHIGNIRPNSGHFEPETIPILGDVAAGMPILAVQNHEGSLPRLAGSQADFALKVAGDSMIDIGILDGDLVLVQQASSANSGEIVVALVGGGEQMEATVKRYLPQANHVVLRPENVTMEDIVVQPEEDFQLAGRVVGVLRWWA
ncbi:MAG: transcriptional repressor LexA [Planctomycetota bacterium]|jgi:repressor LexA|nr:transcriptional repressor LexA [Planctomycetota bacterium]